MKIKERVKVITIFLLIVFIAIPTKIVEETMTCINSFTGLLLRKILVIK